MKDILIHINNTDLKQREEDLPKMKTFIVLSVLIQKQILSSSVQLASDSEARWTVEESFRTSEASWTIEEIMWNDLFDGVFC